ncbi:MAG: hypothetical protein ABIP75_19740 [Pyrinomonadaceae bacterium]
MRKLFMLIAISIPATTVAGQNLTIADTVKLPIAAGEAQSTVVPPGKNSQCLPGRFLVSNDNFRPPNGVVSGQNLDQPGGTPIPSTFDMGSLSPNFSADPAKTKYTFGSNDHDLVSLSNGDVLYITSAWSRMPLNLPSGPGKFGTVQKKDPDWFKDTFRGDFGPNARTVVLVFRSTDCGANFTFLSEMDPLRKGDGLCAMPQIRDNDTGVTPHKPWDMGGTDGQLVKVDPANDHIFLTFQCVGNHADESKKPEFVLDRNNPINKTLVLMSTNHGASWKDLGYIDQAAWRFGVIPLESDELGFGLGNSLLFGHLGPGGKYVFDTQGIPASSELWGWDPEFPANKNVPVKSIFANMWVHPILTRTPDAKSYLLAYPDVIGQSGFGYRVSWFDRGLSHLSAMLPVFPSNPGPDNFIFHLTAVDPGKGPILLYWYDFDSATKMGTIRGRLIIDGVFGSEDFTISQSGGQPNSFALTTTDPAYWYGDYLTAGGYVSEASTSVGSGKFKIVTSMTATYVYYPMWVEPDGTVNYTRLEYAIKADLLGKTAKVVKKLHLVATPIGASKPWPQPVALSRINRPARELTRESDVRREPKQIRVKRPQ